MKLSDFNGLDEIQQAETLLEQGVCVAQRMYKGFRVFLYQVNHFYVEVYYHLRHHVIQGLHGFECTSVLEPYLPEIDLSELKVCRIRITS